MELAVGTLVGILIGTYCAAPLKGFLAWLDEQHPGAVGYIWLGAVLAFMSAAMQWMGFCVVVTTFLLFHAIKGGGLKYLFHLRRAVPKIESTEESKVSKKAGKAA